MKKGWFFALSLVALLVFLALSVALAEEVRDPVCGMKLESSKAKFATEYKGQKYYFCSADCQAKFEQNPERYAASKEKLKEEAVICCALSQELLAEVKIERKERADGLEVSLTSDKPEVVKKLEDTLGQCLQERMAEAHGEHGQQKQAHGEHMAQHQHMAGESQPQAACCLMHDPNYEAKLIKLTNGIRLELKKKS